MQDVLQVSTFFLCNSYTGPVRQNDLSVHYSHAVIYIITDQQITVKIRPVNQR